MGLKDKTSRCSERLISRHLSLRLGYTPAPELVRAQREKFRRVQNSSARNRAAAHIGSLYDDINLNRTDLSEYSNINTGTNDKPIDMAEERIEGIESDVSGLKQDVGCLKTDITSMNEKIDDLLTAMKRLGDAQYPQHDDRTVDGRSTSAPGNNQPQINQNASSASTGQTTNQHGTNGVNNQQNSHQTAPHYQHRLRTGRNMSQEDFIQKEMDKDSFSFAEPGKYGDIISIRSVSKPYMYVYRDGLSTMKQKLDARQSITGPEYIDATLSLLADPRAFHPDDYADIYDHLRKVSRDAMERPWHLVRRWSQYIWDEVESGAIVWADRDIIQQDRVRMCLTGTHNATSVPHHNTYQIPARRAQGMQEVTCRAYNTRNGCPHRESHVDGQVFALHICTYCDSLAKTCYHSVRECERRITHTRNDTHHGRNRMHANGNQHQFHNGYNYQNHAQSKNGF